MTDTLHLKFITCWANPEYRLDMYYKPFKPGLWITFTIFVLFMAIFKLYFIGGGERPAIPISGIISNILFMLAPVVEDFISVPRAIEKLFLYRIAFGLWLLQAVVLTQYYMGLLISSLTTPMDSSTVETTMDLYKTSFENISDKNHGLLNMFEKSFITKNPNNFDIILSNEIYDQLFLTIKSIWHEWERMNSHKFHGRHFYRKTLEGISHPVENPKTMYDYNHLKIYNKMSLNKDINISTNEALSLLLFGGIKDIFHFNYTSKSKILSPLNHLKQVGKHSLIEEVLVKCGKSLLLDYGDNIDFEHKYLTDTYDWITFFKSKDEFKRDNYAWWFEYTANSRLPQYFSWFIDSGCFSHWATYFNLKNKHITKSRMELSGSIKKIMVKPILAEVLNLENKLQTFFHVWGIFISLTISSLIFEIFWVNGYVWSLYMYYKIAKLHKLIYNRVVNTKEYFKLWQ